MEHHQDSCNNLFKYHDNWCPYGNDNTQVAWHCKSRKNIKNIQLQICIMVAQWSPIVLKRKKFKTRKMISGLMNLKDEKYRGV
jgi:hypothetical protein